MAVGVGIASADASHPSAETHSYAEAWDGTSWDLVDAPGGFVQSVSCVSETFCMAVGIASDGEGAVTQPYADIWDGKGWETSPVVIPPATFMANREAGLSGVSCLSATSCVAVGEYQLDGNSGFKALAERWDAGAWTIGQAVDPGPSTSLAAVSCSDQGGLVCMAVGGFRDSSEGSATAHAVIETSSDGSDWSVSETVDAVASNTSDFAGVSCSSATQCEAVGTYEVGGGGEDFLLSGSWSGQGWVLAHNPAGLGTGASVSCLDAEDCIEVGYPETANGWDGTSWTALSVPAVAESHLQSLSCVPGFCAAVGYGGTGLAQKTLVMQGCAWSPPASSPAVAKAALASTPDFSLFGSSSSSCPLVFKVVPLEGSDAGEPLLTGLHFNTASRTETFFVPAAIDPMPHYVANRPFSGRPFAQKCGTGCSNVIVYVREPGVEEHPVDGATVTLQAYQVAPSDATYPYPPALGIPVVKPEGFSQFKGELCVVDGEQETECGARVQAKTDGQGIAYFRYWPPGAVKDGKALLSGSATDTSPACDCRTGSDTAYVYVAPNIVFDRYAPLSKQAVAYFSAWWDAKVPFDDVSWATNVITTFFPEAKGVDELGKFASLEQNRDITAALVLCSLFHLQPDGLLVLDYRDSLKGLFGGGFLTSLVSVLKEFSGRLHSGALGGHSSGVMHFVLSEQSFCSDHGSVLGTSTGCEKSPLANSFILFSLGAAGDRFDLQLSSSFNGAPPTSLKYSPAQWMTAQEGSGLIIHRA